LIDLFGPEVLLSSLDVKTTYRGHCYKYICAINCKQNLVTNVYNFQRGKINILVLIHVPTINVTINTKILSEFLLREIIFSLIIIIIRKRKQPYWALHTYFGKY